MRLFTWNWMAVVTLTEVLVTGAQAAQTREPAAMWQEEFETALASRDDQPLRIMLGREAVRVREDEANPHNWVNLAEVLAAMGRINEALGSLREAKSRFVPQPDARYYRVLASILARRGETDAAEKMIDEGLKRIHETDEAEYHRLWAIAGTLPAVDTANQIATLVFQERFVMPPEEQRRMLEVALGHYPANPRTLCLLANLLAEFHDVEQAREMLDIAEASDADSPLVTVSRIRVEARERKPRRREELRSASQAMLAACRPNDRGAISEILMVMADLEDDPAKSLLFLRAAAFPSAGRIGQDATELVCNPWAVRRLLLAAAGSSPETCREILADARVREALGREDTWQAVRDAAAKATAVIERTESGKAQPRGR